MNPERGLVMPGEAARRPHPHLRCAPMPGPILRALIAAARTLHRLPARLADLDHALDRLLDRLEHLPPVDLAEFAPRRPSPLDLFDRATR